MPRTRIFDTVVEQMQNRSENLLDGHIIEEFSLQPSTVGHDDVAPLVVLRVRVEMRRKENRLNACVHAKVLSVPAVDSLFGLDVTLAAQRDTVVEIVAAVRPEPTFDDVVGILSALRARHTGELVASEDTLSEVVSTQNGHLIPTLCAYLRRNRSTMAPSVRHSTHMIVPMVTSNGLNVKRHHVVPSQ